MRDSRKIPWAAALMLMPIVSQATTTLYTSASDFAAQVEAGAFKEDFDGLADPPPGPASFSGSGYAYMVSGAISDLYLQGGFLGTNLPNDVLTLSFTGHPVTAIGADFFATDLDDAFQALPMTITLSDGTTTTFTPGNLAQSFRGFVSDVPITSLVVSGPSGSYYGGLDDLTVGSAVGSASPVPEPGSWALMAVGCAALLLRRRTT